MGTQQGGVRPFGISLLLADHDHNGPQLYQIDPSGSYFAWKASAIGKQMVSAKTFLEKRYNDEMELEDAIHTALLTLKEGSRAQWTTQTSRWASSARTKSSRCSRPPRSRTTWRGGVVRHTS